MQTLAFDGGMGASGDMILAALLAAGADRDALAPVEDALDVRYAVDRTTKNGIRATTVDVLLTDAGDEAEDGGGADEAEDGDGADEAEHGHSHEDGGNDHSHEHDGHSHDHTHAEGHGHTRTYREVVDLVDELDLPGDVARDARRIFTILGKAEAAVHGTDIEETAFHEVGADDAIADVVGACLLLDDLGVERVVTTPLATGGGTVEMSHGTYPVPTPAVVNIAAEASWELQGGPVDAELLTPTGAAILAHFAEGVDSFPPLRVEATGYGAGGYTFGDHPNVLRATVGEQRGGLVRDGVRVLETNVDDADPELLGGLQTRLKEAGARDVTVLPATMKKSRPGHLVKVVVRPADVQSVARVLAEETGTLGVRETSADHRWVAERRYETVELAFEGEDEAHEVTVKVASDDAGEVYDVSAEYDDCEAVAGLVDLPTREVMRRAEAAVHEDLDGDGA
ncbi:nickel pincer cofactor biosynthesis protein LarC [Haloglomus halophilum]|uniref:nickel pincer cofactor biosynthesis protein LarC n=1 Tax=Haloglomus halophilum TaxID=2962672 RepID=UPI0020C9E01A|nr:nickel pincer cofactor biosynthesis protein LarC [Haloglomus halophilum]